MEELDQWPMSLTLRLDLINDRLVGKLGMFKSLDYFVSFDCDPNVSSFI